MVIGLTMRTIDKEIMDGEYAYNRFNEHYYPEGYFTGQYSQEEYANDVSLEEVIDYEERTVTEKKNYRPSQTVKSSGPMDSPWPMYCHDVRHTGRSPYSTADNPGWEMWRCKIYGSSYHGAPTIDNDGIIYVGRDNLYAVYPNGTLKWEFDYFGHTESAPSLDENGVIYVGTTIAMPNYLHAVYTTNGTLKWKYKTGNHIDSSPAIGDDGTIYFGDWNGYIHAVYPNGTRKWRYKTGDVSTSSPAIGLDGTIFCGSHDDYVYALYPNNGSVKWKYNTGSWVHGSPTIGSDGTVYIGSDNEYLYAFYPNNGTVKWKCKIGYVWGSPALDEDGTIYAGTWGMKFYAIYSNGTKKWSYNAPGRIWFGASAAICSNGIIYFGTTWMDGGKGAFIALNSDGTERWKVTGTLYETSPAIAQDGTVYACSSSENLHAFGVANFTADANGPYYGIVGHPVQFNGKTYKGVKPYEWLWDFGDGEASDEQNPIHTYTDVGNHTVILTVTDNEGNITNDTTWTKVQATNDPPEKPIIDGRKNGEPHQHYDYTFISTDLEDNPIWYYIDWGDNTSTGWLGPYTSYHQITLTQTWHEAKVFIIKAKAKDVFDAESEWTTFEVNLPRNKIITNTLFLRWLERFPIFQKILDVLRLNN